MAENPVGAPEGNQNAIAENRVVRATLRRVAAQNPEKLRKACEKLLNKAVKGDTAAFKEFRDTLDGKPNQSISGPDESPIKIVDSNRPILTREEWLKAHVGTAAGTTK